MSDSAITAEAYQSREVLEATDKLLACIADSHGHLDLSRSCHDTTQKPIATKRLGIELAWFRQCLLRSIGSSKLNRRMLEDRLDITCREGEKEGTLS